MINVEDKDFNQAVLEKIKTEKISPKPKWQFLLKNSLIWILGILSLILGAISTSLVFYMLTGEDSGIGHGPNILEALFFVIPFFWIICLTIFAVSVFFYIKHTKKGYKYSAKQIILFIIAASLLLGGLLNLIGVDRFIDDELGERAPFYDRVINPRLDYWSNPDSGRLTGMIVSQEDVDTYNLIDRNGEVWVVAFADDSHGEILIEHPVRLVGKKVADHQFVIKDVMSVGPGRGFFKRPHPGVMPKDLPIPCHSDTGKCALPIIIQTN
jgi:hypothetical protein